MAETPGKGDLGFSEDDLDLVIQKQVRFSGSIHELLIPAAVRLTDLYTGTDKLCTIKELKRRKEIIKQVIREMAMMGKTANEKTKFHFII